MRKMMAVVLMAMATIVVSSWAQAVEPEKVFYYEVGDKGYFQYPWVVCEGNNLTFVIWPDKTLSGSSRFSGLITPTTKIAVVNRKIGRKHLDLLTGKPVIAYGRFKQVGQGEGSKTFCLELTIFLLSEFEYTVPIKPPTQVK